MYYESTLVDFYKSYKADYESLFKYHEHHDYKKFLEKYRPYFRSHNIITEHIITEHINPKKNVNILHSVTLILYDKINKSLDRIKKTQNTFFERTCKFNKLNKTKINFPVEIWINIISYTKPHDRPKFTLACKKMYEIYQQHVKNIRSLDPTKHIFYQRNQKQPETFEFTRVFKRNRQDHIELIYSKSKTIQRALKYDENFVPYCISPYGDTYIYKIEKKSLNIPNYMYQNKINKIYYLK